jgi:hypothetical protein
VHFSVQADHLHLLIEADDKSSLSRGLMGLAIRVARAVNRALRRQGRVWADRFHSRALTSPREVRNAIVYVLMNAKKHVDAAPNLDPCSSAAWFTDWTAPLAQGPPGHDESVTHRPKPGFCEQDGRGTDSSLLRSDLEAVRIAHDPRFDGLSVARYGLATLSTSWGVGARQLRDTSSRRGGHASR